MQKIMQILFLSCLKATALIEKKLHIKISFTERIQLKMHKTMCKACANYEKQSILIDKVLSKEQTYKKHNVDIEQLKQQISESLSK